MNIRVFTCFSIALFVALFSAYSTFRVHFSGARELAEQLKISKRLLETEKLKTAIAYHEIEGYRQEVATLLPGFNMQKKYEVRALASISRTTLDMPVEGVLANSDFKRAKLFFRDKDYKKSNEAFSTFVSKYKYSVQLPEAYFLLVEGLYQLGLYETCLKELNTMVQQFPDNELTGFAMLRMGQIYEKRESLDEARSMYKTVLNNFENRELKKQAQVLLEGVGL